MRTTKQKEPHKKQQPGFRRSPVHQQEGFLV